MKTVPLGCRKRRMWPRLRVARRQIGLGLKLAGWRGGGKGKGKKNLYLNRNVKPPFVFCFLQQLAGDLFANTVEI